MSSTIAKYYTDELDEWKRVITFYTHEMDELEVKLHEVIERNTIPEIGARVERHQQDLNMVSGKFYKVHTLIENQEQVLKKEQPFIDDKLISIEIEQQQSQIRLGMKETEKEYVDIKYGCYSFFADTIIKQAS